MAGKDEIVCNPTVFDSREVDVAEPSCFVVMPFSRKNERMKRIQGVYENHIKPAVVRSGLRCVRGDDFPAGGKIMEQIWEAICQAEIIIGEFTTSNPNVIYEVGIAHTLGKPMIGIIQKTGKIPFDHLHLRFITYEDSEEGYAELGCRLEEEINKQRALLKQQGKYYPKKNNAAPAGPEPAQQLRQVEQERDTLRAEKDELQSKYDLLATEYQELSPSAPFQKSEFKWTNLYKNFGGLDWLVLDVDKQNNRALLLSKDIIAKRVYNEKQEDVTWKNCTLRAYLNDEFKNIFSREEWAKIALTHNDNPDNIWGRTKGESFDTAGGEPTDDHIFLLSVSEILEYIPRILVTYEKNVYWYEEEERLEAKFSNSGFWWWLRTPGHYSDYAALVKREGSIDLRGTSVDFDGGVRPALWLNP